MNEEQSRIFGYIHESGECYCVLCSQMMYGFALNEALARGVMSAVRLDHKNETDLHCVKCRVLVLAPSKNAPRRLAPWRDYVEKVDLGKEL